MRDGSRCILPFAGIIRIRFQGSADRPHSQQKLPQHVVIELQGKYSIFSNCVKKRDRIRQDKIRQIVIPRDRIGQNIIGISGQWKPEFLSHRSRDGHFIGKTRRHRREAQMEGLHSFPGFIYLPLLRPDSGKITFFRLRDF